MKTAQGWSWPSLSRLPQWRSRGRSTAPWKWRASSQWGLPGRGWRSNAWLSTLSVWAVTLLPWRFLVGIWFQDHTFSFVLCVAHVRCLLINICVWLHRQAVHFHSNWSRRSSGSPPYAVDFYVLQIQAGKINPLWQNWKQWLTNLESKTTVAALHFRNPGTRSAGRSLRQEMGTTTHSLTPLSCPTMRSGSSPETSSN